MIAFLQGSVAERGASDCVIEVGGVGMRVAMSTTSLAALPHEGDAVRVYTHLHVREDELALFGFLTPEEKALFELLITVSGVGPKVALAALSSYAPSALAEGIAAEDAALVSSVPGIGTKTAQRIILELRDKVASSGADRVAGGPARGIANEAKQALLSMGFTASEVEAAIKGAPSGADSGELVKQALRRLGGGEL